MSSLGTLISKYLNRYQTYLPPYLWVLKRDNGTPVSPEVYVALGDVPAGLSSGQLVYRKADGTYALSVPTDSATMPATAIIEDVLTETSAALRPLGQLAEIRLAGLTAGSFYVVGNDSRPAKAGDSTFPLLGIRQVIGQAADATWLRIDPALASAWGPGSQLGRTTDSVLDLTNSASVATLESFTLPANYLRAGSIYEVSSTIVHAAGVSTNTFTSALWLGGSGGAIVGSAAFNVADAGDQSEIGCKFVVRTAGGSGSFLILDSWARCSVTQGRSLPNSAVIPADTTAALVLALKGQFSGASSADHARCQALTIRQVS